MRTPLIIIGIVAVAFAISLYNFKKRVLFSFKKIKLLGADTDGGNISFVLQYEVTNPTNFFIDIKKSPIQVFYKNILISSGYINAFSLTSKSIVKVNVLAQSNLESVLLSYKNFWSDLLANKVEVNIKGKMITNYASVNYNEKTLIQL
jgi:LEA14-like dessication related protein